MKTEEIIELVLKEAGHTFHYDTPATRNKGLYVTWKSPKKEPFDSDINEFAKPDEKVKVLNDKGEWVEVVFSDIKTFLSQE